jgi:ligand-binding SRPBCC domain-containing protein
MNWMTEITQVHEKEYFVDEQRFGPYAMWHHQHHFKQVKGGVQMTDLLNYAIPYSFIGRIANGLFIGKQIREIFDYREKAIKDLFGTM